MTGASLRQPMLALLAVFVGLGMSLVTARAYSAPYIGVSTLTDAELAVQRGGFLTAGGVTLDFGADMKTYVDGQLALETTLNWTAQGATTEQIGPGGVVTSLPAGSLSAAMLTDPTGTVKLIQSLSSQAFANVVLNTASNKVVSQSTNITLTLPGFGATQQSYQQALVGMNLAQQLGMALTRVH